MATQLLLHSLQRSLRNDHILLVVGEALVGGLPQSPRSPPSLRAEWNTLVGPYRDHGVALLRHIRGLWDEIPPSRGISCLSLVLHGIRIRHNDLL